MKAADALARLHDVRDPPMSGSDVLADALAGGSIGLASALLIFLVVLPLARRPSTELEVAREELLRARRFAPGDRLLAQAKLLDRFAPEIIPGSGADETSRALPAERLRAELREVLYRPTPAIDLERLDTEILALVRASGC